MRGSALAGVYLLALAGLPLAEREALGADGTPSATAAANPVEYARSRYRLGVDSFQARRFVEAIDYFLEADRLSPNAALSFNIARAYEMIDDSPAALRWYRDYLRRSPEAQDRADVEALIRRFEQHLAGKGVQQITVLSTPPGAKLVVDGEARGVTPWTGEIPAGAHRVGLELAGHEPLRQEVELAADRATDVSFTLVPAVAPAPAPSATAASASPTSSTAPAADRPPERDGRSTVRILGWTGIAVGGAALGGALVFELLRSDAETKAKNDRTQVGRADKLDTMEGRQTAARVLAGAGAALALAGGAVLWFGREKPSAQAASIGLACTGDGCGGAIAGAF